MRTLAAILLLAVACQARPEGEQVDIAKKVEQLNHTLVAAAEDVRIALGAPTPDEALNILTQESNRIQNRFGEVANNLKQVAEKHSGKVSEDISNFARSLNETFVSSTTSLNLEQQVNHLQTSLNDAARKWQEFTAKVQPSLENAWTSVQGDLAKAADKIKDAANNLHTSIQSAVQKTN